MRRGATAERSHRETLRWHCRDDCEQDILDTPIALRCAVEGLADYDERAARWFLHLREICGRALDLRARTRGSAEVWHELEAIEDESILDADEPDSDLESERVFGQMLRDVGSPGMLKPGNESDVRLSGEERIDRIFDLVQLDRDLERAIEAAQRSGRPEMAIDNAPPGAICLRTATRRLASWLGVNPKPRASLDWISTGRRGPDRAPRKRRDSAPKAPRPSREQKAAARDEKRLLRVLALLSRYPDGLSKKGIFDKITMGRTELTRALDLGLRTDVLEKRGSLEDPRYCVVACPIRKTANQKVSA